MFERNRERKIKPLMKIPLRQCFTIQDVKIMEALKMQKWNI